MFAFLRALKAALDAYKRERILQGWDLGEVYVYPAQLQSKELGDVARELGLSVLDTVPGEESRWKLTLDRDGNGEHLCGVAVCVSDDSIRRVVRLERAA